MTIDIVVVLVVVRVVVLVVVDVVVLAVGVDILFDLLVAMCTQLSAQEGLTKDLLQKKDKADKMIAALRNQVAEREALLKSLMRSLHGLSQQVRSCGGCGLET